MISFNTRIFTNTKCQVSKVVKYIYWKYSIFSCESPFLHKLGLIGSSSIPVNSATIFSYFLYFYQSQIFMSALFVNKNLPPYSGLIFSKLQRQFSFKIHVNLAPDVQNMCANCQWLLSARNYFVDNFPTQLSKSMYLIVMWISHNALCHYGYDIIKLPHDVIMR